MNDNSLPTGSIDPETQKRLNMPLVDPSGTNEINDFLDTVIKLVDSGKIQLHTPDSVINHAVYDKLQEAVQGKVDLEAVNILVAIRDIHGLYHAGYKDTFQMKNLVERLFNTKSRLEDASGDVFVI